MLLVVTGPAFLVAGPAFPQAGAQDDPFAGVEEMIVTGSGTAALLAPQSTSSIAFDSGDLEAYGVEDISDIAAYVPNLEITSQNATNASFFVRGVGLQDFGANASSSVPIFQDGVPRNPSATQLVGLFDIGGLSVLKGPQGSGNYRNSSAGAFLVQAAKPTGDFSGFAKVTIAQVYSVDARDANKYDFETAANSPIIQDVLSARISARYSHENPWFENGCANRTPFEDRDVRQGGANAPYVGLCGEIVRRAETSQVPAFLSRYLGEIDDFGFRGQIRLEQTSELPLEVTFRGEISRLNRDSTLGQHIGTSLGVGGQDSAPYQDPDNIERLDKLRSGIESRNPGLPATEVESQARDQLAREIYKTPLDRRPYRGDFDTPGRTILDTNIGSMTAILDLDDFDTKLNFGYVDYRKSERRDTDLSPNKRFPSNANDQAWEVYGDLAFTGDVIADVPIEWDTGLYTLVEKVEATLVQSVFQDERTNTFTQEIYSWGTYVQGRYEFLEAFTLAAGFRYNWERKDFDVQERIVPPNPNQLTRFRKSRNQKTWDAFTGFGEIRYEFTEDLATYFKYTRGFKAGHFNPSRPLDAKVPGAGFADPEQIDAFEWGLDYGFWAGRVTGQAAFFFYNYENYQVFRLTTDAGGVFRTVQNARQARNYGAEVEFNLTPLEGYAPEAIEGLRINFRGGWLETNYVEFTNSEQRLFPGGNIGVSIDYSGNGLISAPNLQVAATFTWPILLGRLGTLTPQYDLTWTDDTPFDPNNGRGEVDGFGQDRLPPYLVGNRAYTLHNVRLTWEAAGEGGVQLSGWCRNVTDERYKTFSVDISTFSGQILNFVGDPRTCGADFRFSW